MKRIICLFALVVLFSEFSAAVPQVDESSVEDWDQFIIDNSQCLALAESGGGGSSFAKNAVIGAGVGAGSGAAFGAMTGGDVGSSAAFGAVVGGLGGGGRSVYRSASVDNRSFRGCMEQRGYRMK